MRLAILSALVALGAAVCPPANSGHMAVCPQECWGSCWPEIGTPTTDICATVTGVYVFCHELAFENAKQSIERGLALCGNDVPNNGTTICPVAGNHPAETQRIRSYDAVCADTASRQVGSECPEPLDPPCRIIHPRSGVAVPDPCNSKLTATRLSKDDPEDYSECSNKRPIYWASAGYDAKFNGQSMGLKLEGAYQRVVNSPLNSHIFSDPIWQWYFDAIEAVDENGAEGAINMIRDLHDRDLVTKAEFYRCKIAAFDQINTEVEFFSAMPMRVPVEYAQTKCDDVLGKCEDTTLTKADINIPMITVDIRTRALMSKLGGREGLPSYKGAFKNMAKAWTDCMHMAPNLWTKGTGKKDTALYIYNMFNVAKMDLPAPAGTYEELIAAHGNDLTKNRHNKMYSYFEEKDAATFIKDGRLDIDWSPMTLGSVEKVGADFAKWGSTPDCCRFAGRINEGEAFCENGGAWSYATKHGETWDHSETDCCIGGILPNQDIGAGCGYKHIESFQEQLGQEIWEKTQCAVGGFPLNGMFEDEASVIGVYNEYVLAVMKYFEPNYLLTKSAALRREIFAYSRNGGGFMGDAHMHPVYHDAKYADSEQVQLDVVNKHFGQYFCDDGVPVEGGFKRMRQYQMWEFKIMKLWHLRFFTTMFDDVPCHGPICPAFMYSNKCASHTTFKKLYDAITIGTWDEEQKAYIPLGRQLKFGDHQHRHYTANYIHYYTSMEKASKGLQMLRRLQGGWSWWTFFFPIYCAIFGWCAWCWHCGMKYRFAVHQWVGEDLTCPPNGNILGAGEGAFTN